MLNNLVVLGRLKYVTKDYMIISLSNVNNETCEVKCTLSGTIGDNVIKYCSVDDIIGVKGHLSTNNGNDSLHIVTEKVTFLSRTSEGGE